MLANDMRRLAEEISNAYEERVGRIAEIKQETEEGLARFRADLDAAEADRKNRMQAELKDMADQLRSELEGFKSDLGKANKELADRNLAGLKEMSDKIRSDLSNFMSELARFKADLDDAEKERKEEGQAGISQRRQDISNLRGDTLNLLENFGTARKEMWDSLKSQLEAFMSELARFKADLDDAEKERQEAIQAELNEKAEELRGSLTSFRADLSATVAGMMGELKMDRSEAVKAWSEILSTMRFAGGEVALTGPAGVEAELGEAIEKEKTELEAKEEITKDAAKREGLMSEIPGLLKDNPDGFRMVEIADLLGIEKWRSLIPVMRDLMDNGEITKEDSTYYCCVS